LKAGMPSPFTIRVASAGAVLRMRPEYGKNYRNYLIIERSARGDFRRIAPRKKQLKSQTGNPV
jgi:hypothetical protein